MIKLFVGLESGTGKSLYIERVFHMLVTGQTRLSGKTTLLKSLARQASEKGYKVLILDSVPAYTPILIKDEEGKIDILPIEDFYNSINGIVEETEKGESLKCLSSPMTTLAPSSKKHEANWKGKIQKIVKHPYDGKLIRLNTISGLIDISPNHSVIVARPKERVTNANTIKNGNILSMPPIYNVVRHKSGDFIGTKELAWLLGLFAAEGWCRKGKVKHPYGTYPSFKVIIANSKKDILQQAKKILEENFHQKAYISKHYGADTIEISSEFVYNFFKKNCYILQGNDSTTKRVPKIILNAPLSIKQTYLDGYLIGDGNISSKGLVNFTTTSQCLAMGIIWLMNTIKKCSWSTHIRDDKPDVIQVNFNKGTRNMKRSGTVKKVREINYVGNLYDLELDYDHTFCGGIGPIRVHNSKTNVADYDGFGQEVPICLQESTDPFVLIGLLESIFRRKLTPYYATLTRISEGAKTFQDVITNAESLEKESHVGFVRDACAALADLLKRLQAQTLKVKTVPHLELPYSINRMSIGKSADFEGFEIQSQQLIAKTVFEEALKKYQKLIIILDEASKFLPQKWSSACSKAVQDFVTQSGATECWLWMGCQFLATTSKDQMKTMSVKLLGRQDHDTECQHTLDLIPFVKGKFSKDSIMQLKLGHFVFVTSENTEPTTVYAVPEFADRMECLEVALGTRKPQDIHYVVQLSPEDFGKVSKIVKPTESKTDIAVEIPKQPEISVPISKPKETVPKQVERKPYRPKPSFSGQSYKSNSERIELLENNLEAIRMRQINLEKKFEEIPQKSQIDEWVQQIQSKTIVYEVAPLEKLQKDFQEEAKNKIIQDVSSLDEEQKKILKFVETVGKGTTISEIMEKCLFINPTSGGSRDRIQEKLNTMDALALIRKDQNNRIYANLKAKIEKHLEIYNGTQEEIQAVHNHVLITILK